MQVPHAALLVIAKAPVAGRAKTRLCPPLSPARAAELAQAALCDTLEAVLRTPATRRVLVLEGSPGDWLPAGIEVIPQRPTGFAERLAGAFADVGEPAFLIGMDTPQVTAALLDAALQALGAPATDAALGLCHDGGYWGIGLRRADARVFAGVPMSTDRTGVCQRLRLAELGLRTAVLPVLRDVDRHADAVAVARQVPASRFARALERAQGRPGADRAAA
ncbi:MAG: TIGR04282 family arsenosugar biosynthesis glycosyltransferase [Solirubrobacteraceae bacterium]